MMRWMLLMVVLCLVGCAPSRPSVFSVGDLVESDPPINDKDKQYRSVWLIYNITTTGDYWLYNAVTAGAATHGFTEQYLRKVGHVDWSQLQQFCTEQIHKLPEKPGH